MCAGQFSPPKECLQQVSQLVNAELDNQTDNTDLTQPRKTDEVAETSNQFPHLYNDERPDPRNLIKAAIKPYPLAVKVAFATIIIQAGQGF